MGIQLGFAPVADVNNNPSNPIINVRSFGENPADVGRFVAAEVRGLQDNGMVATAKHFPGHGDTDVDSHVSLPVIGADWARLDSVELVPFRAAIAAGVEVVMSAHIAMPFMDAGRLRPGTVAPEILTGMLRDSLDFHGLIVTDALNMAGVADLYGAEAACARSSRAPIFSSSRPILARPSTRWKPPSPGERSRSERLEDLGAQGTAAQTLRRSVHGRTVPLDSIPSVVGSAAFRPMARDIAARSIVMVKDVGGTVYSLKAARPGLTLVTYAEEEQPHRGNRRWHRSCERSVSP